MAEPKLGGPTPGVPDLLGDHGRRAIVRAKLASIRAVIDLPGSVERYVEFRRKEERLLSAYGHLLGRRRPPSSTFIRRPSCEVRRGRERRPGTRRSARRTSSRAGPSDPDEPEPGDEAGRLAELATAGAGR